MLIVLKRNENASEKGGTWWLGERKMEAEERAFAEAMFGVVQGASSVE